MTETELEYHFCFNCDDRKQCYTKPKDCTRIQEEIGLQEMTNEEYIHSLNTEQLAEYLADKFNEVVDFILHEVDENAEDIESDDYWYRQDVIVEWLKKPHTKE